MNEITFLGWLQDQLTDPQSPSSREFAECTLDRLGNNRIGSSRLEDWQDLFDGWDASNYDHRKLLEFHADFLVWKRLVRRYGKVFARHLVKTNNTRISEHRQAFVRNGEWIEMSRR